MNAIAPEGYMRDAVGNLIAVENVRPIDKARDEFVREKIVKIKAMHKEMKQLKAELLGDFEAFLDLSAERYEVRLGGKKGNVALESFDGQYQIQRQISEHITFDEGLQAAKILIDECLNDWTKGSDAKIRTLVTHAFRVDKQGKLNTGAILGLRRLEINDDRWQKAMQAISDSVKVTGTKAYVRAYERSENGDYDAISLDIAAL